MKRFALLGLIFCMGALIAQEPAPQKQDEPKKERREGNRRPFGGEKGKGPMTPLNFKSLVQKFDKNKDEVLSKDEVDEKTWTRLSKYDKDMDNKVTEKEFLDGRKQLLEKALGKKQEEKKKD